MKMLILQMLTAMCFAASCANDIPAEALVGANTEALTQSDEANNTNTTLYDGEECVQNCSDINDDCWENCASPDVPRYWCRRCTQQYQACVRRCTTQTTPE